MAFFEMEKPIAHRLIHCGPLTFNDTLTVATMGDNRVVGNARGMQINSDSPSGILSRNANT